MENRDLAVGLTRARTEDDVVDLLTQAGFWDSAENWRPYGDMENNFSTIGNQQSHADAALVEKLTNSIDAVLLKECLKRGIDPAGDDAPPSMAEAMEQFFGIRNGQISELTQKERAKLAREGIILAEVDGKTNANVVIADFGEGQTPARMPDTILSLNKSNKARIAFVQGTYNMGGTGALSFCRGEYNIQVILSRRCPDISDKSDPTHDNWSVTVVRHEHPTGNMRNSIYTYLVDEATRLPLQFSGETLEGIVPMPHGEEFAEMEYGTYIKLFNYDLTGYTGPIMFDFHYRLAALMPRIAYPIMLHESRDYKGHGLKATLSGLQARLADDRDNKIEEGFPDSSVLHVDGQKITCQIYLFKEGDSTSKNAKQPARNYRKDDGILFTINGQTHATMLDTIFNRVKLPFLAKSLLVIVDCSELDGIHRESMFMTSRDRLRNSAFSKDVEKAIKELLSSHQGLAKIQHDRQEKAVKGRLADDKPLQDVLQGILKSSPVLSTILLKGTRLSSPFASPGGKEPQPPFEGKRFPTFFTIKGSKGGTYRKGVPIDHGCRIQFKTDAVNDYFTREIDPGMFVLERDGANCDWLAKSFNLFNGTANLTLELPRGCSVGDTISFVAKVVDPCLPMGGMECPFDVNVLEPAGKYPSGAKHKPKKQESLSMPKVVELHQKDLGSGVPITEQDIMTFADTGESKQFYLYLDNPYLLSELKAERDPARRSLLSARFKYSLTLIGMGALSYCQSEKDRNPESDLDEAEEVRKVSAMIGPLIIPLITSMADLKLE